MPPLRGVGRVNNPAGGSPPDGRLESLLETYVNWCEHGQEVIPFPLAGGSVRFVPVVGEAV